MKEQSPSGGRIRRITATLHQGFPSLEVIDGWLSGQFAFRNSGRLGCPYDYTHFESDLTPLLKNVHDAIVHVGKRQRRAAATADLQAQLIQLRREMEEAVEREDYERASEIRDELLRIETESGGEESEESEADQ